MFGKKKNKKQPKIEKVFDSSSEEEQASAGENLENTEAGETRSDIDEFLGIDSSAEPEDNLTEEQKEKVDKLNTVKGKISQILQSQNIEIVDETAGTVSFVMPDHAVEPVHRDLVMLDGVIHPVVGIGRVIAALAHLVKADLLNLLRCKHMLQLLSK